MSKFVVLSFLVGLASAAPISAADPVIWYRHPAQTWGDALPVGDGRLAGMVLAGLRTEKCGANVGSVYQQAASHVV